MENIKVVVRVKPLTNEDNEEGSENIVRIHNDGHTLQLVVPADHADGGATEPATPAKTPSRPTTPRKAQTPRADKFKTFTFDSVYGPEVTQREIFKDVEPYITSVVDGFNATVFAYGQTGAGKTYTMVGPSHDHGIIGRSVALLFQAIAARPTTMFTIRVSYVELHLDNFVDLLDPELNATGGGSRKRLGTPGEKRRPKLEIHEMQNGDTKDVFLTGSESLRTQVGTEAEVTALIERGARMRAVAATNLNQVSSRSHTILTFHIEAVSQGSNITQFGKLHLVDLAGSERLKKSGAEGETQKETLNINSSLTALADVLSALSSITQAPSVVPYRNSKLTRLLQDSLGGNSKTFFIVNVHPSGSNYRETLMSLQYGQRAKLIKNSVVANREITIADSEVVKQLQVDMAELRRQLEEKTKQLDELRAALASKSEASNNEETSLKQKIARLSTSNDKERTDLERRLSTVQHSHRSELAEQQYAYVTLQATVDDFRKQLHSMKVKQVLDLDEIEQLKEVLRETRAEIASSSGVKISLEEEKAALEEQLKEVERRAETEAGALAKKVKELESALAEERRKARQAVREEKDEAGIAKVEMEERAEALQAQLEAKSEELGRVRADDAKKIRVLEKQLHAVESERESVRKTAEALEEAKRDIVARDRRIESLRSELEKAQQARDEEKGEKAQMEQREREQKEKDRKEKKEHKEREQKKKEMKEQKEKEAKEKELREQKEKEAVKKKLEEVPEDDDDFVLKKTKSKKFLSITDADETVNAEWEDVALDVVKKVNAAVPKSVEEKKEKKHSEAKERKEKPKKKDLDLEAISSHTVHEEKKEKKEALPKSHLNPERERFVEKMFSSPSKPYLQVEKEVGKKAPIPQHRSQLLSPLRAAAQAAQAAQREQDARIGKKANKRHSDEAENEPAAPVSKQPRSSPLVKVPSNVLPVVSAEPKKRKLLNDKTAMLLSPAPGAGQPDNKPIAVPKKTTSTLRDLFKGGKIVIPKLLPTK